MVVCFSCESRPRGGSLKRGEGEERTMGSLLMKAEGGLLRKEAATKERQEEGSREGE